jgi:molecular chaperone GrpE
MEETKDTNELELCQEQLQQERNRVLYLQAEFDNYKRRLEKERGLWIEAAQDTILVDVLPILDDLERALAELRAKEVSQEAATHVMGFELIAKGVMKILKKYAIEEIPYSTTFDPNLYEAVMQVASPAHAPGELVAIVQKGYTRQGRVLRPAQVSVAA